MTAEWDDRLISRARAAELVARWPLRVERRHRRGEGYELHLVCMKPGPARVCGQSATRLASHGQSYTVSLDGLLAGVLRHMVMAHDVPLSGAGRENDGRGAAAAAGPPGQVPARPGGAGGGAQPGPDAVGQPDQEAGPGRAGRAEGGEHA